MLIGVYYAIRFFGKSIHACFKEIKQGPAATTTGPFTLFLWDIEYKSCTFLIFGVQPYLSA